MLRKVMLGLGVIMSLQGIFAMESNGISKDDVDNHFKCIHMAFTNASRDFPTLPHYVEYHEHVQKRIERFGIKKCVESEWFHVKKPLLGDKMGSDNRLDLRL